MESSGSIGSLVATSVPNPSTKLISDVQVQHHTPRGCPVQYFQAETPKLQVQTIAALPLLQIFQRLRLLLVQTFRAPVTSEIFWAGIMGFYNKRLVPLENSVENRCNTLLADFLQERSLKRRANKAQERAELAAQNLDIDENIQNEQVTTIPEDLLFKIFILLPADSLYRIQLVCKKWFNVINCSVFIRCHAQRSQTVLICQKLALSPLPSEGKPTSYFHFMDLEQGNDNFIESNLVDFVEIFASCDGLILAKMKNNKSVILANPATRKHTELPLGTSTGFIDESYSLAFCNEEKVYKIVHLLYKTDGYIGCEIMSVGTREWKKIYGPSSDVLRLHDIKQMPVSIDGSLYWMPRINGCDYFVSMNVSNETFVTERLLSICSVNDRLIEFRGVLGLVTHATYQIMEVWFLKRSEDCKENWIKRYSISLMNFDSEYLKAICSLRNGKELVFGCIDDSLHAYSLDEDEMKLVYSRHYDNTEEWFDEGIENLYIPHRNMLTSWEDRGVPDTFIDQVDNKPFGRN